MRGQPGRLAREDVHCLHAQEVGRSHPSAAGSGRASRSSATSGPAGRRGPPPPPLNADFADIATRTALTARNVWPTPCEWFLLLGSLSRTNSHDQARSSKPSVRPCWMKSDEAGRRSPSSNGIPKQTSSIPQRRFPIESVGSRYLGEPERWGCKRSAEKLIGQAIRRRDSAETRSVSFSTNPDQLTGLGLGLPTWSGVRG